MMKKKYKYYYVINNSRKGPCSIYDIKDANLSPETLVWREGFNNWTKYSEVEEFKDIHNLSPQKESIVLKVILISVAVAFGCILAVSSVFSSLIKSDSKKNIENVNNIIRSASFETEEDLHIYVEKFYRDLEAVGIIKVKPAKCIIKFSNMQQHAETVNYHGISMGYGQSDKIEIYINYDSWKHFTKAQKYWLMYHELSHDVLDIDDLPANESNFGKLMYPMTSRFQSISMDQFIEAFHDLEASYLGVTSIF